MTLTLVRVPVRLSQLSRWAAERGLMDARGFDEGRALHHLLAETFGPGALQPFRLLVPPRVDAGNIYGYSGHTAASLGEAARIQALPEHAAALDLARIEGKPMPEGWAPGQRLGFDLQARPVRRLKSALGAFAAGAELDVFLAHVLRHHPNSPPETREASRGEIYLDWLEERLASAARIDRAASRMSRFQRCRVARGGAASEGPEAVFHGTLEITNPDAFAGLLARGVGRHRAYGYGMLLLRAPNRPVPER